MNIKIDNLSASDWSTKGNKLYYQANYEEAIKCYNTAIKLDEKFANPWNGLGCIYYNQANYEEAIKCFNTAIKLDEKFIQSWHGLGDTYYTQANYEEAIKHYNAAIKLDEKYKNPWNGLGNVYYTQANFVEAIKCYNTAIKLDEKYKNPWNGLGNVYYYQTNYEEAIKCYNTTIKLDEKFANPWNGLGNVYYTQANYEEAIKCYNTAIKLDEKFANPWNGLGLIFTKQNKYPQAIEYYKKSFSLNSQFIDSYINLANLYHKLGESEKSIDCYQQLMESNSSNPKVFQSFGNFLMELDGFDKNKENLNQIKEYLGKALQIYKSTQDNSGISLTKISLQKLELMINALTDSGNDNKSDTNSPLFKVMSKIKEQKIDNKSNINKRSFLPFIDENPIYKPNITTAVNEPEIYFEVLRRWNSYTPIIAENYEVSKGGGYFIKYADKGIVIDPGFNFIDNFKNAGHYFKDIDTVFISHAHNDHEADLESILTLLYKYNDEIKESDDLTKEDTLKKAISKRDNIAYDEVTAEQIENEFLKASKRKIINFYMPISVFKFYSGLFELFSKTNYRIHIVEEGYECTLSNKSNPNDSLIIRTLTASHRDMISDIYSVGFSIEYRDLVIIYTGDTGWNEKLEIQYSNLKQKYEDKFIVLLAHIGGFKDCEDNYSNPLSKGSEIFYKNHLGRIGLVKLNETLRPKICLVSEFGEEFKGNRANLATIFQDAFSDEILFFPVDIGFRLDMDKKEIKCITEIELEKFELTYDYKAPQEIKSYEHVKNYSLHYYDANKIIVGELIQVVSDLVNKTKI